MPCLRFHHQTHISFPPSPFPCQLPRDRTKEPLRQTWRFVTVIVHSTTLNPAPRHKLVLTRNAPGPADVGSIEARPVLLPEGASHPLPQRSPQHRPWAVCYPQRR